MSDSSNSGVSGEPQVGVEEGVGRHAEAAVVDLQGETVGDALAHDLHGGVRRREHRGVLQEFGHEVGEVGDGRSGDGDAGQPADLDALVVLDLRDGGPDHVHELDGLAPRRLDGAAPERMTRPSACRRMRVVRWSRRNRSASSSVSSVRRSMVSSRVSCSCSSTWLRRARLTNTSETPARSSACLTAASTAARWRVFSALADLAHLVLVVLQARHLGLHVHLFARREAAHHAGQADTGRLVGVQAQLPEIADEGAADAYGQEEREQQGDQAESAGHDHLGDGVHGDRVDPVLVAVGGVVVQGAEFVEHAAGGGVPALGGDAGGRAGLTGDGRLLGDAQGRGGGVLPEALVPPAFGGGQQREVDVVHHGALGHEVGDVAYLTAGEPAGDQGGAEEGVLAESSSRARRR